MMRIRAPFAAVFLLLLLISAYAGLSRLQLGHLINDKVLHFSTFFILTIVFYWIVDTSRRRTLHMTLVICTLGLGVGSEFLQSFLPNDRDFDIYDIAANVIGSLAGVGLCSWYHKRMLDRKRQNRTYGAVPGEDTEDVELGVGQETGITNVVAESSRGLTLEEEVNNWDDNAPDDWDEEESPKTSQPPAFSANTDGPMDVGDSKKRLE